MALYYSISTKPGPGRCEWCQTDGLVLQLDTWNDLTKPDGSPKRPQDAAHYQLCISCWHKQSIRRLQHPRRAR